MSTHRRPGDQRPAADVSVLTRRLTPTQSHAIGARPGEYLAAAYEYEGQEHWEREEAPRWSCPCGFTFGVYGWYATKVDLYTLTDDGLFDQQVTDCPSCRRNLKKVREEHADGQLGFAF